MEGDYTLLGEALKVNTTLTQLQLEGAYLQNCDGYMKQYTKVDVKPPSPTVQTDACNDEMSKMLLTLKANTTLTKLKLTGKIIHKSKVKQ